MKRFISTTELTVCHCHHIHTNKQTKSAQNSILINTTSEIMYAYRCFLVILPMFYPNYVVDFTNWKSVLRGVQRTVPLEMFLNVLTLSQLCKIDLIISNSERIIFTAPKAIAPNKIVNNRRKGCAGDFMNETSLYSASFMRRTYILKKLNLKI